MPLFSYFFGTAFFRWLPYRFFHSLRLLLTGTLINFQRNYYVGERAW